MMQVLRAFQSVDLFEQVGPMLMDACLQSPPQKRALVSEEPGARLVAAVA